MDVLIDDVLALGARVLRMVPGLPGLLAVRDAVYDLLKVWLYATEYMYIFIGKVELEERGEFSFAAHMMECKNSAFLFLFVPMKSIFAGRIIFSRAA